MTERGKRWLSVINALARDRVIRHQVFLESYKRTHLRNMQSVVSIALIARLRDELDARLRDVERGSNLSQRETDRREALIRSLGNIALAGIRQTATVNLRELVKVGAMERDFLQNVYSGGLVPDFRVELDTPSLATIRQLAADAPFNGAPLSDHWAKLERSVVASIQTSVRDGLVTGLPYREISRNARIQSFQLARRHVDSLVNTSVQHIAHETREQTYKNTRGPKGDRDPLVAGYTYVATIDSKTTNICKSLDGRQFKVGEGPKPPQHFNCRSTTSPLLRSWRSIMTPDRPPPPVKDVSETKGETYNAWLKRQPAEVQSEALGGAQKGAAFRRGKLHVRDFSDSQGRPRSLDEIRELERKPVDERGRIKLHGELSPREVASLIT